MHSTSAILCNGKMNITIIDDEPLVGEYFKESLARFDEYSVNVFSDPLTGLGYVADNPVYCVFLDIHMPGAYGIDLLCKIKNKKHDLPVVMITGDPSMDGVIEALKGGASDFLTKPLKAHQIGLTLEKIKNEYRLLQEKIKLESELLAKKDIEKLNEKLERRVELQTALFRISQEIDGADSEEGLQRDMVELACRFLGIKKAAFLLWNDEISRMVIVASKGIYSDECPGFVVPHTDSILKSVLNTGCPYVASSINGAPKLDAFFSTWNINNPPVICFPVVIGQKTRGILALAEKKKGTPFEEKDFDLLNFMIKKASTTMENMALQGNLIRNFYGTFQSLVTALEAKDVYTKWHSQRVTQYALQIAKALGCSEENLESLSTITFLHDIGKIGIQDALLNKPGDLSPSEYNAIQLHTVIGEKIIEKLNLRTEEKAIIRNHHESWDGSGYPDGLSGYEIPFLARIVCVADAFDAMTSTRSYRQALGKEEAMVRLVEQRNQQFDPQIVDAFLNALRNEDVVGSTMVPWAMPEHLYSAFNISWRYGKDHISSGLQFDFNYSFLR